MMARPVLRRCVACGELFNREQLWRVIRLAQGGIGLDRGMGRSAYLCPSRSCLDEAKRRKRLQRALRTQVADSIIATLDQRLRDDDATTSEAR
ncbi:YlxR family protein [Synechococcus sp. CS-1328]|nr:YlxR family protein [Synechococcus sp. CS-1328]MCT0224485.1 YlxR family protein [Synechococcus sp. CS-1328]